MKKNCLTKALMIAVVFLFISLAASNQTAFAGDSGCQDGRICHHYCPENYHFQPYPGQTGHCPSGDCIPDNAAARDKQERRFAAAQMRYENGQTPGGNLRGGDSLERSGFSYWASIIVLFGGLCSLFILLRQRFGKRICQENPLISSRASVLDFALKPSFALSIFAVLFLATIAGSSLTAPTSAQQEKPEPDANSTAPNAVTTKSVFLSAQAIGGDGITQIGAPVFDAAGNRYVRGGFTGTLTIGDSVLTATRDFDMFVAKYDAAGNPVWARQGSGLTSAPTANLAIEGATALAVDSAGNVYIGGSFVKTLTLQDGNNPSVTLGDDGAEGYNYELFAAKYDAAGNLLWARGGDSGSPKNSDNLETGQNGINGIVLGSDETPYVAGFISGANFLGVPITNFVCSSEQACGLQGKTDIALAKLDAATGAPTRMHVIGGAGDDNALDLAIDNATNPSSPKLYLVSNFISPSIVFPNSLGYETFNNTIAGATSAVISKFESDNLNRTTIDGLWNKHLKNDQIVGVSQIATDPVSGQAYITGYFTGQLSAPSTLGGTMTLINNRTGGGETLFAGYVASLDATSGNFVRLAQLGGAGRAIAFRPDGNIMVLGKLYDTGTFTGGGTAQTLDSFGANDLFVAAINKFNFEFAWTKAIAGSGFEGVGAIANASSPNAGTINEYSPLGIALNASNGHIYVSGDFQGALSLDCITLTTPVASRRSYVAELGYENDATSCRIWTNNDPQSRNWGTPENWNGGVVPAANNSVYVPYRKVTAFNPIYNPSNDVGLTNLSIADNQTLILQQNLSVGGRLDLLGGIINAGSQKISLSSHAEALSVNDGRVVGKIEKVFFGIGDSFTFPVGTENGYSPVTLSNINAGKGGSFTVTANQGAYPNAANNLPLSRAARWWNLANNGLARADLTFKYLPGDIAQGTESQYRAYRLPIGGGNAALVPSTINTTSKTVSAVDISQFSDWTLAQFAPTAAGVSVGGRATARGFGLANAQIVLTDQSGQTRVVRTSVFGYFRFENVPAGATYVISVEAKRFNFAPQIVSPLENVMDLTFTAIE